MKLEEEFRETFKNHVLDNIPVERSETIGRMFDWLNERVEKQTRNHYYNYVRKTQKEEILKDWQSARGNHGMNYEEAVDWMEEELTN